MGQGSCGWEEEGAWLAQGGAAAPCSCKSHQGCAAAHISCSQEHRPVWTTQHVPFISISCGNSAQFHKSTCNFILVFSICPLLVILSSINGQGCGLCNCRNNLLHLTDLFEYLATSFEYIYFHLLQLSDYFKLIFFIPLSKCPPALHFFASCDRRMPHR